MGKFVIKQTNTGYTFSLKAGNGEIICVGGEVYNTLASCKNGCDSVHRNAPIANLEDQTVEGFTVEKNPKFELYTDKRASSVSASRLLTDKSSVQARAIPPSPPARTASRALERTPLTLLLLNPRNKHFKAAVQNAAVFFYSKTTQLRDVKSLLHFKKAAQCQRPWVAFLLSPC